MKRFWSDLLFAPASRRSLVATRVCVAAYSLWLVLSRPMLWQIAEWPRAMYPLRHAPLLVRFGILVVPAQVEHALYLLLMLLLAAVMFGAFTRVTAVASSLLLYHFAPFEEIFSGLHSNGNSGFNLVALALAALAFAEYDDGDESPEYRWPIVFVQMLVALQYLLGGLSKVRFTGFGWYTPDNIAKTIRETVTLTGAPWGDAVASSAALTLALTAATFLVEFAFPLAVVSRRARWIIIPAAAIGAFLRARIYGFNTLVAPLLVVFVNWDWVYELRTSARHARNRAALT